MKTYENTELNIKRVESFIKNLKMNYNDHKKNARTSNNFDDIENSLAFLKDYNEVSEQLVRVFEEYEKKTAGEIIH